MLPRSLSDLFLLSSSSLELHQHRIASHRAAIIRTFSNYGAVQRAPVGAQDLAGGQVSFAPDTARLRSAARADCPMTDSPLRRRSEPSRRGRLNQSSPIPYGFSPRMRVFRTVNNPSTELLRADKRKAVTFPPRGLQVASRHPRVLRHRKSVVQLPV